MDYEEKFEKVCNYLEGKFEKNYGKTPFNIPFIYMVCKNIKNKQLEIDYSQTGDIKEIILQPFKKIDGKIKSEIFTIRDNNLSNITISSDNGITFINRDYNLDATNTHKVVGSYRKVEMIIHKYPEGNSYLIEAKY